MKLAFMLLCLLPALSLDARGPAGEAIDPSSLPAAPRTGRGAAEVMRDLDEARSVRWCATTRGLIERVIGASAAEVMLIEELEGAARSADGLPVDKALDCASTLAGAGRYAAALDVLSSAKADSSAQDDSTSQADSASQDARFLIALCLERLDRCGEAAETYWAYSAGSGALGDYALLFGYRCLAGTGGVAAGAELLRRAVTRWRHSPIWGECALDLSEYYLDAGRYAECIDLAKTIAAQARSGHEKRCGIYLMGRALERTGAEVEAESAFWQIVKDHPSHQKAGRAFRAFAKIKRGRGQKLTSEETYRGGIALSKTGNLKEAYEVFEELAAAGAGHPYWSDAVKEMARMSYEAKRYSDAADRYRLLADAGSLSAEEAGLWIGKCRIRSGREEEAFEILDGVGRGEGNATVRAEALWEAGREMESLGRLGEASDLYRFAADSLAQAALGPSAAWRYGFCLYLLGNWQGALEAFDSAYRVSGAAHQKAQALYWKAKALDRFGRTREVEEALRGAASHGPGVYYGARAAWVMDTGMEEMSSQGYAPWRRADAPDSAAVSSGAPDSSCLDSGRGYTGRGGLPPERDPAVSPADWHFARGIRLLVWGEIERGSQEIREALGAGYNKEKALEALAFYGAHNQAMQVAGDEPPAHVSRPGGAGAYLTYPLGYAEPTWRRSAEAGVDPFLSLAVIRQESRFDPNAMSGAGAHGLMQLMPATAKRLAAKAGIRWKGASEVLDPETNILFGTMELAALFGDLEKLPLVLAGYNAGPEKARDWAVLTEGRDLDCYIEMIGYRQTRDYVKLVVRDYLNYLRLYHPSWGPH